MNAKQSISPKDLTKMAICVALVCISAYIAFPLPFTPALVTAQTVFINLIALILPPKQSMAAIGVYVLLGICGLPVFSGGAAGIGKIFSPTGGFIPGFLLAVPVMSLLKGREGKPWRYILVTICVGMPIIYAFAILFMCLFQHVSIQASFLTIAAPFLFGDAVKCVASAYLAVALNKAFSYQRGIG